MADSHRIANSSSDAAIKLGFVPGSLERLNWRTAPRRAPGDDEVEIEVVATGLNFRDVMFARASCRMRQVERGFAGATLGLEAAGRIVRVGSGVERFQGRRCGHVLRFGLFLKPRYGHRNRAVMAKPAAWASPRPLRSRQLTSRSTTR